MFGIGAIGLAAIAPHVPPEHAGRFLAIPLFVMGCGQGALVTPNQTLALMDVDPTMGSTAGGVLQTGQRIGLAIGQAVIGAVFFSSLSGAVTRRTPTPCGTPSSPPWSSSRSRWRSACRTWCGPGGERLLPRVRLSAVSEADARTVAAQAAETIAVLSGVASHRVVIVLGSGWAPAADAFGDPVASVAMADVPGFLAPTAEGHVGTIASYDVDGVADAGPERTDAPLRGSRAPAGRARHPDGRGRPAARPRC